MGTIAVTNPITDTRPFDTAAGSSTGIPAVPKGAYQIMGMSPLTDCSDSPCRTWDLDCCFKIPVFAEVDTSTPPTPEHLWTNTKNDISSFLIGMPSYSTGSTNTVTVTFSLEKLVNGTWTTQSQLDNNSYGILYDWYSLPIYYYKGFVIKWRLVLNAFGEGCYRFKVTYNTKGVVGCATSEAYDLRTFTCKAAHGTVRFDSMKFDGSIGSIDRDGQRFSLCGIYWVDSIRFPAMFGFETSDEEKRQIELTDGRMIGMRDELVQKFKLVTSPLPKWFHDRFKAYALMLAGDGDGLYVTDYNWNNSDYLINRKPVVRDGGYAPKYYRGARFSTVEVLFREGYQNVSRSTCCGDVYSGR